MTTLTNTLFAELKELDKVERTAIASGPHWLWFKLAIIAVTAVVDIADSLTTMIKE